MKVQDALLKAMAKKITWWAAAGIVGVSDRTMRRWRDRLEKHGNAGLVDQVIVDVHSRTAHTILTDRGCYVGFEGK
jgi:Helix-turn-helix domain